MKKISLYFISAMLLLSGLYYNIFSSDINQYKSPAPVSNIFLYGNNINTCLRSDGILNYDKITYTGSISGLIWPGTSSTRLSADFATGIWIGAKVELSGGQSDIRTASCLYNSIFTPGNIPVIGQVPPQSVCDDPSWKGFLVNLIDQSLVNGGVRNRVAGGHTYAVNYDAWSTWPVDKGAPYVEVNGVPGYQPGWDGDRPGVGFGDSRPAEICFMTYMDYSSCTNNIHNHEISLPGGTFPMGVEVQQLAYAYNCQGFEDSYFVRWKILNKSAYLWDSVYFGIANDVDIGDATDDAAGCDTTRDISFIYNADNNDNQYGANPPALGTRFLQGPLVYTGNSSDTVHLPYRTYIGYKMIGMNASMIFENIANTACWPIQGFIDNGYNSLKGLNPCGIPFRNPITNQITTYDYPGDACHRTGWYDSISSDRRYLQSTGPFYMNSGDTQTIAAAFIIGRGSNNFQSVCEVLSSSDLLKQAYYNGLCTSVNGLQTISGNIPIKYNLYQNYPNPFNPSTKIKFDVAGTHEQNVKLVIYDAIGQVVTTLIDYSMKPGSYETDWNGSDFSSGIYFFRLQAGDFVNTKKMVLIK